ncbi:MAG: response regulator [Acetobacteraceae bacterium]|nr:response regulator [Acetobacteraceae bacterium]
MSGVTRNELVAALPYARRYARALAGNQKAGDAMVAEALKRGLPDLPGRLALYAGVTSLTDEEPAAPPLTQRGKQLLLLTALEELPIGDAAQVIGISAESAATELETARTALRGAAATHVLIIEDEPVIAMDLQQLVQRCGHKVVGVASSEAAAVRLAQKHGAGLILADVNLGRGGDGINAVRRILETIQVPVIFVTAYPERLLTAEGLEPAFIMSKPFDPLALSISTYQAVTAGRVPLA